MIELKTIEQLLYFMRANISLSRYDDKFIENISSLKRVTTNQVVLFHTLLYKYRRQFAKHDLVVEQLVELPWNVNVVESTVYYTDGHIKIQNGIIHFMCPFNRNFINTFRAKPNNTFIWDKQAREYKSEFGTYSLRIVLDTATKFFPTIHMCEITTALINEVDSYRAKFWTPTLVKVNGNLLLSGINPVLHDALKDIDWEISPRSIANIVQYGIAIDEMIYKDDDKIKFFSTLQNAVEHNEILNIIPWLVEAGCDMVYISGASLATPLKTNLSIILDAHNIPHVETGFYKKIPSTQNYKFPVLIRFKKGLDTSFDPLKVAKIIQLVNSEAIDIK